MKNPFRKRARVVTDTYLGYEVQVWRWWFPMWVQPRANTHFTEAAAEACAKRQFKRVVKEVTK